MKQSSHCLIKQFEKLPVVRNSENAAYLKSTLQFQITGGLNKRGGGGEGSENSSRPKVATCYH